MEIIEWLKERSTNCTRIAAQKTGSDQAEWIKDAVYFNMAIQAIADATEQCAIESGEYDDRKKIWSGTMLGEMWRNRIVELRS